MAVLLSTTLIIVGTRFLWYRLLPLHLRELGATDAQVGIVFTVVLLLGPLQFVGGLVCDRWGRRYSIAVPSLALVGVLVIGALARHWFQLALAVLLVSVVSNIQSPGFNALLAESATDTDRGRVFGLFYTIIALAQMGGPAVGAVLLPRLTVSGLIWINALGALGAGMARLLFLHEGQFAAVAEKADAIDMRAILRDPLIRQLIVVNSLFLLLQSLTIQGPFVALHAADSLGMDSQAVNLLFAAGGMGATVAALVGGGLADRVGGRLSSALALLLHAVLLAVWSSLGPAQGLSYVIFTASWIAIQVGIVGFSAWYSAYAPPAVRGRVLGLVGAVATVASAAGPQIGMWLRSAAQTAVGELSWTGTNWGIRLASGVPFWLGLVVTFLLAALVLRMPSQASRASISHTR